MVVKFLRVGVVDLFIWDCIVKGQDSPDSVNTVARMDKTKKQRDDSYEEQESESKDNIVYPVAVVEEADGDSPVKVEQEENYVDRKKTSFVDTKKMKIQLTWKDITITAPPKRRCCRGPPPGATEITILGKQAWNRTKKIVCKFVVRTL